jgi:lipopolysaccharide/colanic/teichoic acid biosynthesis glycosyltransferase
MTRYPRIKRSLDLVAAFLALLLLWPVMVLVAVGVLWTMGRPVLFRQERPGRDEQPFTRLKFRTMRDTTDSRGVLLPAPQRITRFGILLRKASLDELPQLFNVVRGDMSFIGPRPLLKSYLPYYTERERRRHEVRPGITGLAQVSGRNTLPWPERLELDVRYVERLSFGLDTWIFAQTLLKVARRSDVLDIPQDHGGFIRSRQGMMMARAGADEGDHDR